MKLFHNYIFLAFLLICSVVTFANEASLYSSAFCVDNPQRCRISARHIERGGIGYDDGYTSLDVFLSPDPESYKVMPFFDLKGHIFDDARFAANAGFGFRSMVKNRTYGLNAYYDFRDTCRLNYNQVGFGLETLGKLWDVRINGYLPVGKQVTCPYDVEFYKFTENSLLLSQRYQVAMRGAQAELGFHITHCPSIEFYAAVGTYYFNGKIGPQMWGGKARLIASFKKYWTIELSNSYDKVFCNRFQGAITFTLPFGRQSKEQSAEMSNSCDVADVLLCRMVQPVARQEIVVVADHKKCCPARDPATNDPLGVVFVDNTSNSRGTYESPYPTLAQAQAYSKAGDIIYVFPGDGTTKGMDSGIILKNNQKFWGSGVDHSLQTDQGTITIPAQSSSAPNMTNTIGDGITLAPVNQISGFTITDTFGKGVFGTNVNSIDITQCTLKGSQEDQIHLECSGASATATFNDLTIIDGVGNGIFIDSTAGLSSCAITDSIFKGNDIFTVNTSFAKRAVMSLTGNTFEDNTNGTNITFDGSSTLFVYGNSFKNTTSVSEVPLLVTSGTSPLSAIVQNNTFKNNERGALCFILNDTDSATLKVINNTISDNRNGVVGSGLGSAFLLSTNSTTSGNCSLTLTDNTFSGNTSNALYCSYGSFNNFTVNATGNTITDNGASGFVFNNPCSTFGLTAKNNSILRGGDHGISTSGGIMNTVDMTISNNTISGNTGFGNGITLNHEGTDFNLIVRDNTINDNAGSGIIAYYPSYIENVTMTIEDNIIKNNTNSGSNAASGIDLEQFTNLSGTIKNNTLTDNTGLGVYIGSTDTSPSACVTMTGNSCNTDYQLDAGTGQFNLAPCAVEALNSGAFTLNGVTKVQSCPGATPCA